MPTATTKPTDPRITSTQSELTTANSSPSKQPPDWIAVIYDPTRLPVAQDPMRIIVGGGNEPVQCHPIMIGLPPEVMSEIAPRNKGDKPQVQKISRSVKFSPGVTMGVNLADYELALETNATLETYAALGVIRAIAPETNGFMGYRAFREVDALTLINYSYAPQLMQDWMEGENRPAVIKTAGEHRQKLDEELARRAAA